ncbi:MAG: FtsX-like permease family protein, partial [Myxococcota bacterium]
LAQGDATATGVLVLGVDPMLSLGVDPPAGSDEWDGRFDHLKPVLDLPKYIVGGKLDGLRRPGAAPAESKYGPIRRALDPNYGDPGAGGGGAVDLDPHERPGPEGDERRRPPASTAVPPPPPAPPPASPAAPAPGLDDDEDGTPASPPPPDAMPVFGAEPAPVPRPTTPRVLGPDDAGDEETIEDREFELDGLVALPDTDVLPADADPDPCIDPDAVARMPGIVVGASLAETLELAHRTDAAGEVVWTLGDCVTVTSPTIGFSFASGQIKPPVAKRFRVIAVFEAGFDQYDSKLVYTDLYEAQSFYDHGDTVTGVEMQVADINRAGDIAGEVAHRLEGGLYHTMDWEELNHGLFTALWIQQIGMSAVLALIIIVAAFTVVATLIMVVLDKQKEISVLKAMGASDGAVLRMFLYQGAIIGVTGTLLGLLLGFAVCKGLLVYGFPLDPKVYFISRLPVLVRPEEFIITGVLAIVICLVATIVPSLYAANLRPADGFRNR